MSGHLGNLRGRPIRVGDLVRIAMRPGLISQQEAVIVGTEKSRPDARWDDRIVVTADGRTEPVAPSDIAEVIWSDRIEYEVLP